jgi:Zn ribbon nucleic-acid-binding protein
MPLITTTSRLIESVECPKCGKHSIVNHGDKYHCLNCSFQRDLSDTNAFTQVLMSHEGALVQIADDPEQIDLHPIFFIAVAVLFGLLVI